jgi:UrcA family protein
MNKFSKIAAGLIISASAVCSAHAVEVVNDVPTITVRYADLNLDNDAGRAMLVSRLQSAARQVCYASGPVNFGLTGSITTDRCMKRAVVNAIAKIDNPSVTTYAVAKLKLPSSDLRLAAN